MGLSVVMSRSGSHTCHAALVCPSRIIIFGLGGIFGPGGLLGPGAALAALGGCESGRGDTGSTPTQISAEAPKNVTVVLELDGQRHQLVATPEPRPLETLLPAPANDRSKWRQLTARGAARRHLRLDDFAKHYADHRLLLSVAKDSGATLTLLRPAKPDVAPHVQRTLNEPLRILVGVTSIVVSTESVDPPAAPEERIALQPIAIATPSGTVTLDGEALESIPQTKAALDDEVGEHRSKKLTGWHLRDILAHAAVTQTPSAVQLVGEGGESLDVSRAELSDPRRCPMLRSNRRGDLKYELWLASERSPQRMLRGVTKVIVK